MFYKEKHSETKQRFTIKKFKVGVASVLIGTLFVGFAGQVKAEEAISSSSSVYNQGAFKAINHDKDDLTPDQINQIMSGLPDLSNLDCGDTVHFVFQKDGKVVVTDKNHSSGSGDKTHSSTIEKATPGVEKLASQAIGSLPRTGSKEFIGASLVGFITLGSGIYLLYRHRKTAKLMIVLLALAGSGVGTLANANTFNVSYKESKVDFKQPEMSGYVYVGYWIEEGNCEIIIPEKPTPEVPKTHIPTDYPTVELPTIPIIEKEVEKEVIVNKRIETIEINTPVNYETEVIEVDDLPYGEHRIKQQGVSGMISRTIRRTFVNDVQEGEDEVVRESSTDPVKMIIEIGKKPEDVIEIRRETRTVTRTLRHALFDENGQPEVDITDLVNKENPKLTDDILREANSASIEVEYKYNVTTGKIIEIVNTTSKPSKTLNFSYEEGIHPNGFMVDEGAGSWTFYFTVSLREHTNSKSVAPGDSMELTAEVIDGAIVYRLNGVISDEEEIEETVSWSWIGQDL